MSVTIQGGQHFDPKFGKLSEKPELEKPQKSESRTPSKMIDESMAYVIDDKLQNVIDNYKESSDRLKEKVEEAKDSIDNGVDESFSEKYGRVYAGNGISYAYSVSGDPKTFSVDLRSSYYIRDSIEMYEEQRKNINALKDRGYSDEDVDKLLESLDDKFASKVC